MVLRLFPEGFFLRTSGLLGVRRRTPTEGTRTLGVRPGVRLDVTNLYLDFSLAFQLAEVKQANVNAILRALEYPSADMEAVIHNLNTQYDSKYNILPYIAMEFLSSFLLQTTLTITNSLSEMSVDEHLEEPDLRKYAAIDMAALKDVRQTGAEFVRNIEALLHSTPGLAPGYLSEAESTALIVGVSNFSKILDHTAK